MYNGYPKRREVAAEQVEQDERYRAMQELVHLGVFRRVGDMEFYHGRASDGKEWHVLPNYDNSGNKTGNRNINKVSALSTSSFEVAREFAKARSGSREIPKTYRIASNDPDAVLIVSSVFNLDEQDRKTAMSAIKKTTLPILDGAPIGFEHRGKLDDKKPNDFLNNYGVMCEDEVDMLSKKLGLDKELVMHVGSAINTRWMLKEGYLSVLGDAFRNNSFRLAAQIDGKQRILPLSPEYLANYFRANHIIGQKVVVDSATLGKTIDNYLMFDLEKINTSERIDALERKRSRLFGKIATTAAEKDKEPHGELMELLKTNLYAKPQDIIDAAKKTPGFGDVFDADAGNWEKFTLGEHTETVLRIFDDNFADILPASVLPIMRLALLVHDIGKPTAVKANNKRNQRLYNVAWAEEFMKRNNIDELTSKLVVSMIGDGMALTSKLIVDRYNKAALEALKEYCKKIVAEYMGEESVEDDTVFGFQSLLEVLQICDSAAYTTMAVTRSSNGVQYRNYGSFNGSFDPFTGFTGKRVRIKND